MLDQAVFYFFAALAIFGFGYLAYDEAKQAKAKRSEAALHPTVDREHDAGDEG